LTVDEARALTYQQDVWIHDGPFWTEFKVWRFDEDTGKVMGQYWDTSSAHGYYAMINTLVDPAQLSLTRDGPLDHKEGR
jgi:hypothetical protein